MADSTLHIVQARTFLARLGGLLARRPLRDHEALYLAPCSSVHTFFMRYPIDVAFLDRKGRVLKVVTLAPWRVGACLGAHAALELRAGQAARRGVVVGKWLDVAGAVR